MHLVSMITLLKQELCYQPKPHQLMRYHLKRPSKTLICISTLQMLSVVELAVLHLLQKSIFIYIVKKDRM